MCAAPVNQLTYPNKRMQVKCEDAEIALHPRCAHGPKILLYYEKESDGIFVCSAYRNSECSTHVPPVIQTKFETKDESCYCLHCNEFVFTKQLQNHLNAKHNCIKLDNKLKRQPTLFLTPLDQDEVHAQYFFDQKALDFFAKMFINLKINKVLCIGAPHLHGYLCNQHTEIKTYLLDMDERFGQFYAANEYACYNMCNNYFYNNVQYSAFKKFLKNTTISQANLLIFIDPPFGCRTELIANTLKSLTLLYNNVNHRVHQPVPIIWIFPYYLEYYIKTVMPELEMSDYKINYTNHSVYTDVGKTSRKLGSPVRMFTNVPFKKIILPKEEGYIYCQQCHAYKASENRHCAICYACTAKNGDTYRHCMKCGLCVKPNYVHCNICRRCTQKFDHNCAIYQTKQHCWICRKLGHTEHQCALWKELASKERHLLNLIKWDVEMQEIVCLLCGEPGHNEMKCKIRSLYLNEISILGNISVNLK